jgi:hypothetical protein
MTFVGNKEHQFQIIITQGNEEKKIYAFPTKEAMMLGCKLYKSAFPEIKIEIHKMGVELN